MALLDDMLAREGSALVGDQAQALIQGVIQQAGGLQGLASRFNSWVRSAGTAPSALSRSPRNSA